MCPISVKFLPPNCSEHFAHQCDMCPISVKFLPPNCFARQLDMCPISVKFLTPKLSTNLSPLCVHNIFNFSLFVLCPISVKCLCSWSITIYVPACFCTDGAFVWTMKTLKNYAQQLFVSLQPHIRRTATVLVLSAIFATHWVIFPSLG